MRDVDEDELCKVKGCIQCSEGQCNSILKKVQFWEHARDPSPLPGPGRKSKLLRTAPSKGPHKNAPYCVLGVHSGIGGSLLYSFALLFFSGKDSIESSTLFVVALSPLVAFSETRQPSIMLSGNFSTAVTAKRQVVSLNVL